MNICLFVYDFPHKKSVEGMMALRFAFGSYHEFTCIAAPPVTLTTPPQLIRVSEKSIRHPHPRTIANLLNWDYDVSPHNEYDYEGFDFGVVLGARILSQKVIDQFPLGIINIHPGVLPQNRGLDTIEWAILERLPQGATSHLIEKDIDRGLKIDVKTIPVYEDDSLVDMWLRLMSLQMDMIVEAVDFIASGNKPTERLGKGTYHNYMPPSLQRLVPSEFPKYKEEYARLTLSA